MHAYTKCIDTVYASYIHCIYTVYDPIYIALGYSLDQVIIRNEKKKEHNFYP
jgi:hypothetical protein